MQDVQQLNVYEYHQQLNHNEYQLLSEDNDWLKDLLYNQNLFKKSFFLSFFFSYQQDLDHDDEMEALH